MGHFWLFIFLSISIHSQTLHVTLKIEAIQSETQTLVTLLLDVHTRDQVEIRDMEILPTQ